MSATILFLLLTILPQDNPIVKHEVDIVETNYVYDEKASLQMTQYLFWKWNKYTSEYECVDWILKKPEEYPPKISQNNYIFKLGNGAYSHVRCKRYIEYHSQVDRELESRNGRPGRHDLNPPLSKRLREQLK